MSFLHRRIAPPLAVAIVGVSVAITGTAAALGADDEPAAKASARANVCALGSVNGTARVRGVGAIGPNYTSTASAIDKAFNCAGGDVQVRRAAVGKYFVRFLGNPASVALVSANEDGAATPTLNGDTDNLVTAGRITTPGQDAGAFRVDVQDIDSSSPTGTRPQEGQFTIVIH